MAIVQIVNGRVSVRHFTRDSLAGVKPSPQPRGTPSVPRPKVAPEGYQLSQQSFTRHPPRRGDGFRVYIPA
ncbi:MAG: hypothetical protein Q7R39_01325 [Dehalococcoidia bacterium]|nr:hypothetical protein [Dehalococcoidia bacterium]